MDERTKDTTYFLLLLQLTDWTLGFTILSYFVPPPTLPYLLETLLYSMTASLKCPSFCSKSHQNPLLRTPNPGFNPEFTPPLLYKKCGGKPRVKPGVWRPEMWTQVIEGL
jgi:hypothetical protein